MVRKVIRWRIVKVSLRRKKIELSIRNPEKEISKETR
jgi:hypothetical protein